MEWDCLLRCKRIRLVEVCCSPASRLTETMQRKAGDGEAFRMSSWHGAHHQSDVLRPTSKAKSLAPSSSPASSVQHTPVQFWNGLGDLGSVFEDTPEYEEVCKHLGVWATVQEQEEKAQARADRADSPEPDRQAALWGCEVCGTFNTVHNLTCSVASCMARRPVWQDFRADLGDWFCPECNNHNRGYRKLCNWTACPSRDWVCECGNLNRSNRKFCQTRTCGRPRPIDFD